MSRCRPLLPLPLLVLGVVVAAALPTASAVADTAVGTSAKGTAIVADGGYAAWRADDGRLVVQPVSGGGAARETTLKPPASAVFDVGTRRGGGAQVVWAESCSTRSHRCAVRSATLRSTGTLSTRVLAHIPYHGGGSPALAITSDDLAYTVRDSGCDVPYFRTLPSTSARRLDRGHCADIAQLDLTHARVGVLAHPGPDRRATEARVIPTHGGRSRTLQRETQGEESNFIVSIAFDGADFYTARGGIRQANAFTRFRGDAATRLDARAFVNLDAGFTRDRNHNYYNQVEGYEAAGACPCVVVAGQNPYAGGARQLIPALSLAVSPAPVYVDSDPTAVTKLTRQSVTRTALAGGPVAVPGVPVELQQAVPASFGSTIPAPKPTGATATTDADGLAEIRIPGGPVPFRFLAAVARPAGGVAIPTSLVTGVTTFVHMTATATRLADGRLQISGAITPAQPGRKVRLDRKLGRACNAGIISAGTLPRPNQVGVPAGCFDSYTQDPVTTAAVSADGTSYTLTAPASSPAGTYSVSLNSPRGTLVFAGETAGFAAP